MIETLLDGLAFPECPRWRDGHLWFSEKRGFRVSKVDEAGAVDVVLELDDEPGGLGWLPDGRMLVVSQVARRLLRVDPDGVHTVADLAEHTTGKCNDMVVDAEGRAYVGHLTPVRDDGSRDDASLVVVSPDGDVRVAADGLAGPNGGEFLDGGRTLVLAESLARRLLAFTVEPDGSLRDRRTWADLAPAAPDGICVDAEGAVWFAAPLTREVIRVEAGGTITDRIAVGELAPFACALGGGDGRTLFVCSDDFAAPFQAEPTGKGQIQVVRL
ncbi:MAG: SMP-30/gluconolactonase/LRE family protein [Chloroflexi bacterium]|nr:SMP-30/gluconolactonase/LRE family protein [Chloroflexota bacterium]